MSSAREIDAHPKWLLERMKSLGFKPHPKGMCKGLAYVAAQERLAENLSSFDRLIFEMYQCKDIEKQLAKAQKSEPANLTPKLTDVLAIHALVERMNVLQSQLINPLKKEEDIAQIDSFSYCFTPEELSYYFQSLKSILQDTDEPFTLILHSSNHTINVSYDKSTQEWVMFNANKLPGAKIKQENIVEKIFEAFITKNYVIFSTEVLVKKEHLQRFSSLIREWKNKLNSFIKLDAEKAKQEDRWGATWLHVAAAEGHTETVDNLVEHNAHLYSNSTQQSTPLYMAVQNRHYKIVKILLDNQMSALLDNPLFIAAQLNYPEIIELLLTHPNPANPNQARETDGATPLIIAIDKGCLASVDKLLVLKCDPNKADNNGNTPLHIAVKADQADALKKLLEYGANPNILDHDGVSSLFLAVLKNNLEMVTLLLGHGADPKQAFGDDDPLSIATERGYQPIVAAIKQAIRARPQVSKSQLFSAQVKTIPKVLPRTLINDKPTKPGSR